jgi:hypothetical protein
MDDQTTGIIFTIVGFIVICVGIAMYFEIKELCTKLCKKAVTILFDNVK